MKRMWMLMCAMTVAASASLAGTAMAAEGAAIYQTKCVACHGVDGKGTAMGPAFAGNEFVASASADEVSAVILKGRNGADKKYKDIALGMPAQQIAEEGWSST